ncbi:MAG TPA: RIP metalloprotease RseP [Opitutaceae bacterium]|nr:RIP metalloprotease RseP [Opitutaceae bacterium]
MASDLLNFVLSNLWAVFLIVLFFGGSIFVHELGHFLAARRRGMHVDRFSIGFGPRMFGWTGKDGVEYRVSWLPLGGYVALPQLADLKGLEGETAHASRLPPASYSDKMIVAVAGAVFNLIFAFALASILWVIGQPVSSEQATTRIGYISPTIELADGSQVTSPAKEAGLRVGDTVRAIDGTKVEDWQDLLQTLVTGSERALDGRRMTVFTIERDGQNREVILYPLLAGDEKMRKVGIGQAYELLVHSVKLDTVAATVGLRPKDRLVSLDTTPILNIQTYAEYLMAHANTAVTMTVIRDGKPVAITIPPRAVSQPRDAAELGIGFNTDSTMVYESPLKQFRSHLEKTWQTLSSLVNPNSDIGISKLSGPIGIMRVFHMAAQADFRLVLWFTILVNINLAVFNLLPIPVLDGGHMLFATIGKLRGRALPANFIATTQSIFVVLLFSMMLYVSIFDVRRMSRDFRSNDKPAPAQQSAPSPTPTPANSAK